MNLLSSLAFRVSETEQYFLEQTSSDSQVWNVKKKHDKSNEIFGILVVYVDDFLLQAAMGPMRTCLIAEITKHWTLGKEAILTPDNPITFLGIELTIEISGDLLLKQTAFINSIFEKYGHLSLLFQMSSYVLETRVLQNTP